MGTQGAVAAMEALAIEHRGFWKMPRVPWPASQVACGNDLTIRIMT